MLFATHYSISPLSFDPPGVEFDDIDLRLEERLFRLTITSREHTDSNGDPFTDILVVAMLCIAPSPEEVMVGFTNSEIYKLPRPESVDLEDLVGPSGFPESYFKFISEVRDVLDREANRLFGILRWRTGIRGGPPALRSEPEWLKWCDGDWQAMVTSLRINWKSLPHGLHVGVQDDPDRLRLTPALKSSILELSRAGEPFGQDLLQEAWRLVATNPRSSLTTGVAAVETRLKELITDLVPQTAWLIKNIPSPSVSKLATKYLEELPARCTIAGRVLRPSKTILRELEWAIEQRNDLVHGSLSSELDAERVKQFLRKARSLLYLLDYYAGYEWASEWGEPAVLG